MTIDEYFESAPEPHRTTLLSLRETIRELLPDATEVISYGMPAFKVAGQAIAGYAHFKNHCSYFPHSATVLPEIADELVEFDWDKGTLRFPPDRSLPASLVERLVATRLGQLGLG